MASHAEVSDAIEEVVNGEIRIVPAPTWNHSEIVQNTYDQIRPQVEKDKVRMSVSKFDLIIRRQPLTARQPDFVMFLRETIIERDGRIHSPPQFIGEVLSPANTRREREEKLADYAALGVPEVWILSPEARSIAVLRLKNGRYNRIGIFAEGAL